jgi:hypothetical protein
MTRYLVAVALALSVSGCAVDTDDPLPAPAQKEPQRDPPAQTLGGQLQMPLENTGDVGEGQSGPRPTFQPPIPSLKK